MTNSQSPTLKVKLRGIFWPIYSYELKKFLPMCALMFCILFNQNILRILKDSILISEISAEASSFVKLYCVTPAAALFVVFYAKIVNHLNFKQIFQVLTFAFISFFCIFAFIIYPNITFFHKDASELQQLMTAYPNFKWYIAILGNWSFIVFYTLSELWPNIFYTLLFWQCANAITSSQEAKRFYMLFSLFGNSSLIFVGLLMMNLASEQTFIKNFIPIVDSKITLIQVSTILITIAAFISCLAVKYVSTTLMNDEKPTSKPASEKMGLIQSFRYIASSKYLWLLLICSAAFGLSMNLVESVWKAKIKETYQTVNAYAEFNSMYILWTGVFIMTLTFVGNHLMRKRDWFFSAVITPILIVSTGTIFFILVIFDSHLASYFDIALLATPLALSVGTIQNILAKGAKYSLWDTSREMLYIPLDNELKTKGKAAVDVVSSKVGKSASGLVQSMIFTLIPSATFSSISPLMMFIFIVVCLLWIYAIYKISFEFKKLQ